jgi:hypothetical protein
MHMKMKRNNKTDVRPGEKGARSFRRSFGMVALSVFAAVAVALFGAAPAFAAELQLPAPDHSKTAVLDPETGKINITLSVTGKTDSSQSKTSANLIVVLDTSGSMDEIVNQREVRYARENDWSKGGRYGLVGNSYVKLYELDGQRGYWYTDGYYWYPYNGQRYKRTAGTRLAVAKQALSNLADQLISSKDSTVKIALETFSGNGNKVSDYYKAGQSESFKNLVNQTVADGGTNWADALTKANEKALEDTSTPTYIVFLSDGKPTFGTSYPYGDGTESPDNMLNLNHFINDAVEAANNKPDNVYGLYAIYTGADAADAMNTFASATNALPNKAAINGSDSTALNNAFNNIVTTIKNSISYTNVKITDSNSDVVTYVLPTADSTEPTFTYKKGDQTWTDAPEAHVVNNHVEWNLGNRKLEQGETYSVSFEVKLTQDAYNKAAPADGQKATTNVYTNSAATLAYSTVVSKDGHYGTPSDQHSIDIDSPTVEVPTSKLAITKTWDGDGDKPSSLVLKVKQDGKDYKTVTMTPDTNGNWKSDVTVATGPSGHNYTIDEVEPEGWSETTKASAVPFKSLISETKSAGLTNTYKSGTLTLTKKIKGNAANTSDHFTFELNCDGLKNKSFTSGNKTIAFDGTGKATVDLNNDETVTLNNVPAGKTIDITETTKTPNANTTTTAKVGDTSTTFDKDATKIVHATVTNGETTAVVYTNQIDAVADTGISFSFGPQVALLGVAMAGVFGLVIYSVRKNHGREE